MTMSKILNTKWQIKALLSQLFIVALMSASWLWSPTRSVWDGIDLYVFHTLNASISDSKYIALVWAVMNMRPVDGLVGILLFSLILTGGWTVHGSHVRTTFIAMIVLLIWMVLLREGFMNVLDAIEWSRTSPSEALADAIKLTQVFPGWDEKYHLKDGSPICFPGDHASVLIIWAMWVSHFVNATKQRMVWLLALLFSLPRLAAGAHWLTDDLIGGLGIALLAYATAVHTPLLAKLTDLTEKISKPLFRVCAKLPLLKQMAFFKDSV